MSRKQKLLLNTITGGLKQVITLVCGFILPRYMLVYYGSSINGLVASIVNFLSFISLLDMGVGAVIQANLYKPLAESNTERISLIVKSSERFFRILAGVFGVYIAILCFVFPYIDKEYGAWFTASLIIIISISSLAQYLFGMTYQLLLNADQRSYIQLYMQIGTIILNTVLSVILMRMGASIHFVKMMTAIVYVLRPLGQAIYVRKHYDIDRKVVLVGEPIKQKWNGFSQHLAAVVCQNIDVVALTVFSTLENVSIYSIYFSVTNGVEQIIMTASSGLESLFGNMLAKGEKEQLITTFSSVEWIVHTGVTIIFTITAITIVPFVTVYTRGITDANYVVPLFGSILVSAYAFQCLRIPYFRIIKAAGHFKETQNGAYMAAALNIVITITLVFKYGLIGAATGTLVAMVYHTCYFVWYLSRSILERPILHFVEYIIADTIIATVSFVTTRPMLLEVSSYYGWLLFAIRISLVVMSISIIFNIAFFRKQLLLFVRTLRR